MSARPVRRRPLYLPDVEAHPQPGVYRDLIESARARNVEYSKIWDLFAFQQSFTVHLARFTHGVLREPAAISPGLSRADCRLHLVPERVRLLHAGARGGGERAHRRLRARVGGAARRRQRAAPENEKLLLRFVGKVTKQLPQVDGDDVEALRRAGWDDEAIYYAITTCALFNFYNRWITACGVPQMSPEAHRQQGRTLAARGYSRD